MDVVDNEIVAESTMSRLRDFLLRISNRNRSLNINEPTKPASQVSKRMPKPPIDALPTVPHLEKDTTDLAEQLESSFVIGEARLISNWTAPLPVSGISFPPVSNFSLNQVPKRRDPNRRNKTVKIRSKSESWCRCRCTDRFIDLEKCIRCDNLECGKWFHLACVDLPDLPQGRYGWSCYDCDEPNEDNGLFAVNDRLEWHGEEYDAAPIGPRVKPKKFPRRGKQKVVQDHSVLG